MASRRSTPRKEISMESKVDFQWEVNNYLCGFVKFADQKASAIIAFFGVVVPVFTGIVVSSDLCIILKSIFGAIGITGLIIPVLLIFTVFKPRTPCCKSGLIFWENIQGYQSLAEYTKATQGITEEKMLEELSNQNWNLSKVLHKKYLWIKWVTIIGAIYLIYYVVATVYIFAV